MKCPCNTFMRDGKCSHTVPLPPSPFEIKRTDKFAIAIIRAWIVIATADGVNPEKIAKAEQHYADFKRWQLENGTKKTD